MPAKLTKTDFILKSRQVHGWRYDYSKVDYKNSSTKVRIICPKHGEFTQSPNAHLAGHRCPLCAMDSRRILRPMRFDTFIENAQKIHGNKYTYIEESFKKASSKMSIICPTHGLFIQKPSKHLQGQGCPICGKSQKNRMLSTEEWIEKAVNTHGNKYDYSASKYNGGSIHVAIGCPDHGVFYQLPFNHLQGMGCPKCGMLKAKNSRSMPFYDFELRASKVHNGAYKYDESTYINYATKTSILCPIHGEFWQTPSDHLQGHGCPRCGKEHQALNRALKQDEVIARFMAIHGDKYDYSKVEYKNSITKVCIVCRKHGIFWQTPTSHMRGHGCPHCRKSRGENEISKWLDVHNISYIREYCIFPQQTLFGRNKFYIDFFLPNYNIFIEFNGAQHYHRAPIWQTEESFQVQQDRDKRLREYCKQHKIKLIEIP